MNARRSRISRQQAADGTLRLALPPDAVHVILSAGAPAPLAAAATGAAATGR
jgi:hypothetical protein